MSCCIFDHSLVELTPYLCLPLSHFPLFPVGFPLSLGAVWIYQTHVVTPQCLLLLSCSLLPSQAACTCFAAALYTSYKDTDPKTYFFPSSLLSQRFINSYNKNILKPFLMYILGSSHSCNISAMNNILFCLPFSWPLGIITYCNPKTSFCSKNILFLLLLILGVHYWGWLFPCYETFHLLLDCLFPLQLPE